MTVTSSTRVVTATGNGATTEWPYSFEIPTGTAEVTLTTIATNVEGDPINPSLYTLTGEDDPNGGTVTYPLSGDPLSSAFKINIKRTVSIEQALDLTNQSPYFPEQLEDQLDLIVMGLSQVNEAVGRAVKVDVGSSIVPADLLDSIADSEANAAASAASAAASAASVAAFPENTFTPSFTGAVAVTQRSVNERIVTPEMFGAVGDGVADDTAAINAALATGKSVLLTASYKVSAAVTLTANGQELYSLNGATLTQVTANTNAVEATNLDNVAIKGLTLVAVGSTSSIVNGCGIAMFGCTNSRVADNEVSGHRGYGIYLQNCSDCSVLHNSLTGSPVLDSDTHDQTAGDIGLFYNSSQNIVLGNRCSSGNAFGIAVFTINLGDQAYNNLIALNTINDAKAYGIVLYRSVSDNAVDSFGMNKVSDNIVNTVTGSIEHTTNGFIYGNGIYIQGAEGTLVSNNQVSDTHSSAVVHVDTLAPAGIGGTNVSDLTILGNKVYRPGMDGIHVDDPTDLGSAAGWGLVSDNEVHDGSRDGIIIKRRGRVRVRSNLVRGCAANGIKAPNVVDRTDIIIVGNTVVGGSYGIVLNFCSDVLVADNSLSDCSVHGMDIQNGGNVVVRGNRLDGIANRAIYLESTITSGVVAANFVRGASLIGVLNHASGVAIEPNDISGPTTLYSGNYPFWRNLPADVTTPAVGLHRFWLTVNTVATLITNFTGAVDGQEIQVVVRDANTTFDFSASNLSGNAGVDYGTSNSRLCGVFNKTLNRWYCTIDKAS